MKISKRGLDLIKEFEGLRLHSYQCSASVWTIGYGHTSGVTPGESITPELADTLLTQDVSESENTVNRLVNVSLNQNQFDALVSFVFNVGAGNFRSSTLLKKLNNHDYNGAAEEFLRWINAGGQPLSGLARRRKAEINLFSSPE